MSDCSKPTKAQRELLQYMVAYERDHPMTNDRTREWSGGDLIDYYKSRWIAREQAEARARGRTPFNDYHFTAGNGKTHAWRRSAGTVLARLADAGFVRMVQFKDAEAARAGS